MTNEQGSAITVSGEGLYDDGDSSCTSTVHIGPISVSAAVVAVGDEIWFDEGAGTFVEASLWDAAVLNVLASCPTAGVFWVGFDLGDMDTMTGAAEERFGTPTQRIDVTEALSYLDGMGIGYADLEGMAFHNFVMWVADPDGWLVALEMDATVDAAFVADQLGPIFGDTGDLRFHMTIDVDRPDDPSIEVTLPENRTESGVVS